MDKTKQAIHLADRSPPVNAVQLRKVLNIMFPHSYIKLYHQPPNSVCSIFSIKTTFVGRDKFTNVNNSEEHDYESGCYSEEGLKYEASSEPSSRGQVIRLQNQLQNSLVDHQAKAVGLCPFRRAIYDQCFGRCNYSELLGLAFCLSRCIYNYNDEINHERMIDVSNKI